MKAKTAFIPGLCTVYQWQQRRARHNRPVSRAAPTEPPLGGAWASSLSAVRNMLKPGNLKSPNRRNASGRLPTQLPEEARTVMRRCASLRPRRRQSELLGTGDRINVWVRTLHHHHQHDAVCRQIQNHIRDTPPSSGQLFRCDSGRIFKLNKWDIVLTP